MTSHTPTPWKVEGPTAAVVSEAPLVKGGRFHVADMRGWGHLTGKGHGALGLDDKTAIAIQEANAALIVEAVNNHTPMIASLTHCAKLFDTLAQTMDRWATESREGGWSTHQVEDNRKRADDCRRYAAHIRSALPPAH